LDKVCKIRFLAFGFFVILTLPNLKDCQTWRTDGPQLGIKHQKLIVRTQKKHADNQRAFLTTNSKLVLYYNMVIHGSSCNRIEPHGINFSGYEISTGHNQ
jgi:hypothetical protein